MDLPSDLLNHAETLAELDPGRPKQVSLRRCVSSCYYALFHLLVGEASRRVARKEDFRYLVSRTIGHREMKDVSQAFSQKNLPNNFANRLNLRVVPNELRDVAEIFVSLQEERHRADYSVRAAYDRSTTRHYISQTRSAFQKWQTIRGAPEGEAFLLCLVFWERWKRPQD